jgi:hypothetical protein
MDTPIESTCMYAGLYGTEIAYICKGKYWRERGNEMLVKKLVHMFFRSELHVTLM